MATRANIIVQTGNDKWTVIYTHYDGYPSSMGVLLNRFHNNAKAAHKIAKLGSVSQMGPRLEPAPDEKHDFDKPAPFCTVFYGRDRAGKKEKATVFPSFTEALASCDNEYVYAWRENGSWDVGFPDEFGPVGWEFKPLSSHIDNDQDCIDEQTRLDNEGQTLAWAKAGCPHEVVTTEIVAGMKRISFKPMPVGYRNPAQVRADRYADEALF